MNSTERFDKLEGDLESMREDIKKLNTKVNGLENNIKHLDNVVIKLVETPIRNTATNIILLFWDEDETEKPTKSHIFTKNNGNLELLEDFIEKNNIEYNKKTLGKKFDKIIASRNECIYPSTLGDLTNEVEKCKQYIEEYPQLKTEFKYEVFTIEHYDDFKRYYFDYIQ
jgi:peptidoglycan hydrolase CwlO-like protein